MTQEQVQLDQICVWVHHGPNPDTVRTAAIANPSEYSSYGVKPAWTPDTPSTVIVTQIMRCKRNTKRIRYYDLLIGSPKKYQHPISELPLNVYSSKIY